MWDINKVSAILLIICIQIKGNFAVQHPRLLSASVLFRHGDRNPLSSYPKDPWRHEKWPGGYSALTDKGMDQEYELGQFLRGRYESILGNGHYSSGKVYVQSTDIDRTRQSAFWCLKGIFPATHSFRITRVPKAEDYLLGMAKKCQRYDREMKRYKESSKFRTLLKKSKRLFQYLSKNSGWQVESFEKVYNLYDILYVEKLRRKRLPKWTETVLVPGGEMESAVIKGVVLRTETTILAKLKAGFFIREVVEGFRRKINRHSNPSLNLYSAHDTTITDVLHSLGLYDWRRVSYAASVHFELYEWNKQHYIQIFYKNGSKQGFTPLTIAQCDAWCPLRAFQEVYKEIIPTGSFREECRVHAPLQSKSWFENIW